MDDLGVRAPSPTAPSGPAEGLRRIEVAMALVERDGRVLLLRRSPNDRSFAHAWCFPGGRVDPGETPEVAVMREVAEETGLRVHLRDALGPRLIGSAGRTVELAIHRFVARASDDRVVLSEEHVDFRWLTRADAAFAAARLPGGLGGEVTAELLERFIRSA